ncbi:cyclic nucleotide-binding domain-containing protein [candidate division WOR-3 bacterium]|nr:cyclic nucleotide-binding domain-containing protein [candidate division WOR-3 bacterium]
MSEDYGAEVQTLKKHFPFDRLKADELTLLCKSGQVKDYSNDDVVFNEGDMGDYFCIILSGSIRISTVIPEVGEESLSILYEGDFFGEMALIDDAPRSAAAIAHTPTRLLIIQKDEFDRMVDHNNPAAYWILWGLAKKLSQRLRETDQRLKAILALIRRF